MKRRGFLRALVGAAVTPIVAQAAPLLPVPATPAVGQEYTTLTFRRKPGFFDMLVYTGDGERKELQRTTFEPALIIVKCKTAPSPWYILESSALPPELNKPGEQYIAYEFGEEAMEQIKPYINSTVFTRI